MRLLTLLAALTWPLASLCQPATDAGPGAVASASRKAVDSLVAAHGEGQRARAERGVRQAASLWRPDDGDAAAFHEFTRAQFAGDPSAVDALFARFEAVFEQVDGHMLEVTRTLRAPVDVESGPQQPVDELLAGYDPAAHLIEDLFENKLAFVVLLNFPLTTVEERGAARDWSRRQWAEARLAQRFARRVPAQVELEAGAALARAEHYVNGYNIWMHRVLTADRKRLFPADMRLLSHWNLRDQIRADYSTSNARRGFARQRLIENVMERIVTQTIPARAIDGKDFDWNPAAPAAEAAREPDTRYARILDTAAAMRAEDPYAPTAPSYIARVFESRELSEARVRRMLTEVLESPLVPAVATMIRQRLGRELRPFDIWYDGFTPRAAPGAGDLDAITARRYPDAAAYQRDIPRLLSQLGFSKSRADMLADHIVVEPARGSGHAWGAAMRGEKARLRTRIELGGMNYKGYNIAIHEMGHNVEQVFSLETIDHTLLAGVPANAFTEAMAFVFQARDRELLGLPPPPAADRALRVLGDFWATFEIAGVAMVEIELWHWIYEHPGATPAQLREAAVRLARDAWNRWYAPAFGVRDSVLLGIYSHMVNYPLYLADYPIGRMIAFQIEEKIRASGDLAAEFERMARIGAVAPDLWMIQATDAPVGPQALLRATTAALGEPGLRRKSASR
jgi:hypothetical protein